MEDEHFMREALALAQKGKGFVSPNPLVGAVVVRDGKIVGRGHHAAVGRDHAEVAALAEAGGLARGADLYVTLEPCNHQGRTPPCTAAILQAGIRRVVAAMEDPNPDVAGGGLAYLRRQGVATVRGVCRPQALRLNEVFVKWVRTKLPFVTVKCAATLDGRIATRTGDSRWVTSEGSRRFVHELRHAADAILVGSATVKRDDPRLTTRLPDGAGMDPVRIVLDTRLSIPTEARVLRVQSDSATILVAGQDAPEANRLALEKRGAQVLRAPQRNERIDLRALMQMLGQMQLTSILIEGGGRVIASALGAGVADKIIFFYAPKILGGDDGVAICRGPGPALMSESIPVRHIAVYRFGDDVMIEGYPGEVRGTTPPP